MSAVCILAAGKTTVLAASMFTLSWTHSVERIGWEEDWRLTPSGFEIVAARVKGSGAGMEPAPEAVLKDGWWTYSPSLPPRQELVLAASGATPSGWRVCGAGSCATFGADASAPILLRPCKD